MSYTRTGHFAVILFFPSVVNRLFAKAVDEGTARQMIALQIEHAQNLRSSLSSSDDFPSGLEDFRLNDEALTENRQKTIGAFHKFERSRTTLERKKASSASH